MTLGEIIKKFRIDHGYSMDNFADISGLSKGYISMLEKNLNPRTGKPIVPSLDTYNSVANALNMSLDDLLRLVDKDSPVSLVNNMTRPLRKRERQILESFNMLNEDGQIKVINYASDLLDSSNYESINVIGSAAAGKGYNYLDNITIEKTIEKKERPKYDFIIQVLGDSMEPKIEDGSLAFVRINTNYDNGKIYVVDDDGSVYIKKAYFEDDKIILKSINKDYEDIEITFSQGFRVLGEVVDWEK